MYGGISLKYIFKIQNRNSQFIVQAHVLYWPIFHRPNCDEKNKKSQKHDIGTAHGDDNNLLYLRGVNIWYAYVIF